MIIERKKYLDMLIESQGKLIIVGDDIKRKVNEQGIVTMGLFDFLLDSNSISYLLR